MTLAVLPLGEKDKWRSLFTRYFVYLFFASVSGSLSGFIITMIIFLFTFWVPYLIKMILFLFLVLLFILHEFFLIKLNIPQRKWQIPSSWLKMTQTKNMIVWGIILGPGIFTYLPYTSFYILFLYIGFFMPPYYGLLFGLIFALSRTIPTLLLAILSKLGWSNEYKMIDIIQSTKVINHWMNGVVLLIVLIYLTLVFSINFPLILL